MVSYRREVDGLRAIAVLSVIIFHMGLGLPGGFVGVDIFLVISGYLITSLIVNQIQNGTFRYHKFLESRARRLAPALLVVLILTTLLAWIILLPVQLQEYSRSLRSVLGFYSNVFFYNNLGYFDLAAAKQPLLHAWSLSLEEQFYFVFPVALLIISRFMVKSRLHILLVILLVSSGLSFVLNIWGVNNAPNAIYYLLPFRVWELLVGSIVAVILKKSILATNSKLGNVLSVFGLLCIALSFLILNRNLPFPGVGALLPVLGTGLVLLYTSNGSRVYLFLSNRILVQIGLISYPLYLWHQPLIVFGRELGIDFSKTLPAIMCFLIVFTLSWLTYKFVELPIRRFKVLSRRNFMIVCAFMSFVLLTLSIQIESKNGFPGRYENRFTGDAGHIAFHELLDNNFFDCEPRAIAIQALYWKNFLRCKQTKNGIPEIVLLGDSHAEHLFLGLAEAMPNRNIAFYIKGERPFTSVPQFEEIFNELLNNNVRQTVLYSYAFTSRSGNDRNLEYQLESTISELKKSKKDVYIIGDIPSFPFDPATCKYKGFFINYEAKCTIDVKGYRSGIQATEIILKNVSQRMDIPYIQIDNFLCGDNVCSMVRNKHLLYRDTNHLNIVGSKWVGRYLAIQINAHSSAS
jgi:peptidoglycan/LPS O-acetylase OafA/YrhL